MIDALLKVIKRMYYPLNFRHIEEMMQEHGVFVDHTTAHPWGDQNSSNTCQSVSPSQTAGRHKLEDGGILGRNPACEKTLRGG